MSRYYVYGLIDPELSAPRYIGKGLSVRTEEHFREANNDADRIRVIGVDSTEVAQHDKNNSEPGNLEKIRWLQHMASKQYKHHHIVRLIARALTEEQAFTLESFLLTYVYDKPRDLLNIQAGKHAQRFRPSGNWGNWGAGLEADFPYYVYVLRDPMSGASGRDGVFYVGKGSGSRLDQHFDDAERLANETDGPERLQEIRRLRRSNFSREQIGYVVARVQTEQDAFLLEALLIKFVYGMLQLANQVAGHYSESIRPKDSWEIPLPGFDMAKVVNPDVREDRSDLLTLLLAEGLGASLDQVKTELSSFSLQFGSYKVLDAGELGAEAPLAGTLLKVFTRRQKLQVELRPRKKAQLQWMRDHFLALGALELLRGDGVFLPACWRGARNMTSDPGVLVERIKLLVELARWTPNQSLPEHLKALLYSDTGEVEIVYDTKGDANDEPKRDELPETPLPEPAEPPGGGSGQNGGHSAVIPLLPPENHCTASLQQVSDLFPDIPFDDPRPRDAGEVCIEAIIGSEGDAIGATLKVSCRKSGYGLELRGRTKAQKIWLKVQLVSLGCNLPRVIGEKADVVFLPTSWKGAENIAPSLQIAVFRISQLLQIVSASDAEDLDDEVRALLTAP